jgi:predicted HAD superfamily Cof-like phosphohydrolase
MSGPDVFEDQKAMMRAFGNTVHSHNTKQTALYLKLMLEEMGETLVAANPIAKVQIEALIKILEQYILVDENSNLVQIFDGLNDVVVVTLGAGFSLGLPMAQGWKEVHGTNMAKVDPKTGMVRRREDGKVLKPEGWTPPDLEAVLIRLGMPRTIEPGA